MRIACGLDSEVMAKDRRIGKTVQVVFRTQKIPRALRREAKEKGTTIAALVRQVLTLHAYPMDVGDIL